MGRILFFLLLALAIYIGWRWMRIQRSGTGSGGRRSPPSASDGPELMVRCDSCGLNLPQSEALPAPGANPQRWYCCEEHRRDAAADH